MNNSSYEVLGCRTFQLEKAINDAQKQHVKKKIFAPTQFPKSTGDSTSCASEPSLPRGSGQQCGLL